MVVRTISSYAEFRKKVLKKEDRLYAKYLARPISSRLSWLILKKWPAVTPNQITVLDFCIGLVGVVLLFFSKNSVEILFAALILLLWSIFDHVDGEIARFKDMKTPTGFFLEITFDYIIVALVPIGTSFYLYKCFAETNILLLGFVDCILLLLYEFVIANYYWTFYRCTSYPSKIEIALTELQITKRFRQESLLVNRYTIQLGQIISRIGSFLTYSGHMILMLILFSLIDVFFKPEFTLWDQESTTLHIFLLPYLFLILYSISLVVSQYIFLETKCNEEANFAKRRRYNES